MDMDIGPKSQPLQIFTTWMNEAKQVPAICEATSMTLATINPEGKLHARVVLCKSWSDTGFTFFTNYSSRKGLDLQHSPEAAGIFFWDPLFRQVKLSGRVSKVSRQESEEYWRSRPRDSQLSQYASQQSKEVGSREELERVWLATEQKFSGQNVPCPETWGGYLLVPETIEFWLGRPNRFHDRFEFQKSGNHWTFRRLYP